MKPLNQHIDDLIHKHCQGTLSEAEAAELENWKEYSDANRQVFKERVLLHSSDEETFVYLIARPAFPFKQIAIFLPISVVVIILFTVAVGLKTQESRRSNLLMITRNKGMATAAKIITPYDTVHTAIAADKQQLYQFKNDSIEVVMWKLRELYNIDYGYKDTITNRFTGSIPVGIPLDEALRLLSKMGHIYFKIDSNFVGVAIDSLQFR